MSNLREIKLNNIGLLHTYHYQLTYFVKNSYTYPFVNNCQNYYQMYLSLKNENFPRKLIIKEGFLNKVLKIVFLIIATSELIIKNTYYKIYVSIRIQIYKFDIECQIEREKLWKTF